jgi:hypothetical protein
MTQIEDLKLEIRGMKAALRTKLDEFHAEQSANYHVKVGDLVELMNGTYGKPNVKVYLISRVVFKLAKQPDLFGYRRFKDDTKYSRSETLLFFRGDEIPKVIGHLNDWRQVMDQS